MLNEIPDQCVFIHTVNLQFILLFAAEKPIIYHPKLVPHGCFVTALDVLPGCSR